MSPSVPGSSTPDPSPDSASQKDFTQPALQSGASFQKREKIFLTGYMGAGKTTIGKMLAKTLGLRFYDTDALVSRGFSGKSIPRIFSENGEPSFREAEKLVLAELCKRQNFVAATGGGTLVRQDTMEMALATGVVIYLEAPVDVLFDRVTHSVKDRPLLAQEDAESVFRNRFQQREAFYRMAHLQVSTHTSVDTGRDAIIADILRQLENFH